MAIYPLEVAVDEKQLKRLLSIYLIAQKQIENELLTATDFGVANRKRILAQIDSIIDDLSQKSDELVEEQITKYYMQGSTDANKQLKNIKAPVKINDSFSVIQQRAIAALVEDTTRAFGESMTGIKRNTQTLLGKQVREEITNRIGKGMISGEALKDSRNAIKEQIRQQGIAALKDRAGRTWTLDRYSEMLYRTKVVEARNRGLINRMVEYDYDLVQVSNHNSDHQECAVWEGRILSLTGNTKGYPTVAEAEGSGLFHPNCKHAINVIIPSLARKTYAYDPDEQTVVLGKKEIDDLTGI